MSYLNREGKPIDPRDEAINMKDGVIFDYGNRKRPIYRWGAMITDLNEMTQEEYMKPSTVIVQNGGSGGGGGEGGDDGGDTPTSGETQTTKTVYYGYVKQSEYDENPTSAIQEETMQNTTVKSGTFEANITVMPYSDFDPSIDIEDEDEYDAYTAQFDIYIAFLTSKQLVDLEESGVSIFNSVEKSTLSVGGQTYYSYLVPTNAVADESTFNYNLKF